LLHAASSTLDSLALGQLVGVLAGELRPRGPRKAVLSLLRHTGLFPRLQDAEFVEGVGPSNFKSCRLLRFVFSHSTSPSEAIRTCTGLLAAGALRLRSATALAALHEGSRDWRPEVQGALAGALAGEMDSFRAAGVFLGGFLGSPACRLEPGEAAALLRAVAAREDVRDLAGDPNEFLAALPADLADEVEEELLKAVADSDASDADAEGNLADFVCGDDEVEFSTSCSEASASPPPKKKPPSKSPARGGSGGGGGGGGGGARKGAQYLDYEAGVGPGKGRK
jgi:hypothetical protein